MKDLKEEIEKILRGIPDSDNPYFNIERETELVIDQLLSLFEKYAEEIMQRWENAIFYSEMDIKTLKKEVMINHLKVAKKLLKLKLSSLAEGKGK